jgi:glycosyltransferase involved in cell wall biosynthesis
MTGTYTGKVGVQQRVLARYRVPLFDQLALELPGGLEVFAGEPRPEEHIVTGTGIPNATYVEARNRHIGRGPLYFCWQRGYKRWLKSANLEALIVAADPRILSTYLAIRYMHSRRRPVIGWGLGTLNESSGRVGLSVLSRLRSRFYRSFDAVIAYSSKAADDYRRAGIPDERIFIAHNAVSTEAADAARTRFPSDGEEVRKWRSDHGLSGMTLICVGRLISAKRLDLLIEACRSIGDGCELLIVGDGPERARLERIAAKRFPSTTFLGHQEGDALSIAFASADVFVLPGTGGLAIFEAMAYGKPVIVGQGDGTEADLVREGRNGRLVRPDDLGELTGAIRKYVGHPEMIVSEGRESRKIIDEEASIERMVLTFVSALKYAVEANT